MEFISNLHFKNAFAIIIGVIIIGVTLMLFTKKDFREWIKPAAEGDDNKASGIRIISFFFALLVGLLVFQSAVRNKFVPEFMFNGLLMAICTIWGVIFVPKSIGISRSKDKTTEDKI